MKSIRINNDFSFTIRSPRAIKVVEAARANIWLQKGDERIGIDEADGGVVYDTPAEATSLCTIHAEMCCSSHHIIHCGVYSVVVEVYKDTNMNETGEEPIARFDICNAFNLCASSSQEGGADTEGIETDY